MTILGNYQSTTAILWAW